MRAIAFHSLFSIVLTLITNFSLRGQSLNQMRWYRIRTLHFDLIFKGNIQREAQRMANTLEHLYEPVSRSLGVQPAKISLVLRNKQVVSNAFVAFTPHRMELFTCPSQSYNFIGTNDWLSLLAVHELRHVAQHAHLKQNFNQLADWLGGDLFFSNLVSVNVPVWFLEGDAVGIETALTHSGRGRIPYFSLLYKANLLERNHFSYAKQILGSYREPVSNHYKVGYYLATYLRKRYGSRVWKDVLAQTTRPKLFYNAVKKRTGKSLLKLYEEVNEDLKNLWGAQLKDLKLTQVTKLSPRNNIDYTDYIYPQLNTEGNIIALKSGMGAVPQFVKIDDQGEEYPLFIPGAIDTNVGFSIAQDQIVWIETIADPIWQDRSYMVIQRYDIRTKRLETLTCKSRYGAASLSPDATKIITCESDESYNHQLVILDAKNGQVLQRLPNPDNHFYLTPKWLEDGEHIVVVKNAQQRVTIAQINVTTEEIQDLLPYSKEHLGCPIMHERYVFYNSAYNGIDNIYALDLSTRQRYQVTSRKYGAYHPILSKDGRWIIFNDFTKDGMGIVKISFDPKQWTPLAQVEDRSVHYHTPLVEQEDNSDVLSYVPNHTYPVERYSPWRHWLHVHSWLIFQDSGLNIRDPKSMSKFMQKIAFSILQSQNLLGTTTFSINYLHNFKEKFGEASAKISYTGWYPVISLEGALRRKYEKKRICHRSLALQLEAPWLLHHGQYTHKSLLSIKSTLHNESCSTWYTQQYTGSFCRASKKSLRDIYFPWSQGLTIQYQHTPYAKETTQVMSHFGTDVVLYFPGLIKHHSFCLGVRYAYKKWESNEETHKNGLHELQKRDINRHLINKLERMINAYIQYTLPICYPDWSLGHLFYLKRLYAETYYQLQHTRLIQNVNVLYPLSPNSNGAFMMMYRRLRSITEASQYENTISLALVADLHLFTILNLPAFCPGVRYSYNIEQRAGRFEIILSMKAF